MAQAGIMPKPTAGSVVRGTVPGTPRWAVVAARLTVWSVLPSAVWRVAVGVGIPLGWSDEHLELERIPGFGTVYVIVLSVLSIAAAWLTFGLVRPWGERIPVAVPVLGGRRLPVLLVAGIAVAGVVAVAVVVVLSIVNWSQVSGFADRPTSGWAVLMLLCYLPAVAWAPLLLAVTVGYVRRRRAAPVDTAPPH